MRGIDREQVHDNPEGTSPAQVLGWHEHVWSEEHGDSQVIPTNEPRHKDIRGVLKAGLKKWNIAINKEQLEVELDG